MKTLDLDFTRATARGGEMETRAGPADRAFEGALRDATERAEARAAPLRGECVGEPHTAADALGEETTTHEVTAGETAAEEAAADGREGDEDDVRTPDDGARRDYCASVPLVVAPAPTISAAQAQAAQAEATPPSCAAGAQRRARPGAPGEIASSASTGGTPALSREREDGGGGGAHASERAGSSGAELAHRHGAVPGGAPPARGAGPAREELGVCVLLPEGGDEVAGARRDVPAADGFPGAAPASHDLAAPALELASLRPQPAATLETTELSRPTPATGHVRSTELGADGAVLKHAAHLRVAAPGVGDVELHLRVLDGVAHLRVDGDAARVVESRAAELSRALAAEGLKLGQVDTRPAPPQSGSPAGDSASRHFNHGGSGHPRDEPPPGRAPEQPAPRRGRASQPAPTSPTPNGGYAVRA